MKDPHEYRLQIVDAGGRPKLGGSSLDPPKTGSDPDPVTLAGRRDLLRGAVDPAPLDGCGWEGEGGGSASRRC